MKKFLLLATIGMATQNLTMRSLVHGADLQIKNGQPCWIVQSDQIELSITELGGHMAPVTFYRQESKPVQPYHISPWQEESHVYPVPVLVPLRGDFFCLPFGGNGGAYRSEKHPPHGETAGSKWTRVGTAKDGPVTTLTLELKPTTRAGVVTKKLQLLDGHNAVYSSHHITGFNGRTSIGHHATLAMPNTEGAFKISHSPIQFGMTNPTQFSDPSKGEYQQFAIGQRFEKLTTVPSRFKDASDIDASRLPQKAGYADLLAIFHKDLGNKPAWLAAVRSDEGWLWYSFKDPKVLTSTVFWLENHGRHHLPWFGRNNCVGLEDVTAFFADGLKASAEENVLSHEGIPTALDLNGDFAVHYIQGVAKIPPGFNEVANVEFDEGSVTFVSTNGQRVKLKLAHDYLKTGQLDSASGR
jgi:hypothetical protein